MGHTMRHFVSVFLVMISLHLVFDSEANSVPTPPHPTCKIKAKVLTLKRQTKETMPPVRTFEFYEVSLEILSVKTFAPVPPFSCSETYTTGTHIDVILMSNEYKRHPIAEGQIIRGMVRFGGDERFNGHFLRDVGAIIGAD